MTILENINFYNKTEIKTNNSNTKTFILQKGNQKYFYKIILNPNEQNFQPIQKINEDLIKNNFLTPKILDFKQNKNNSIEILFEYFENSQNSNNKNYNQIMELIIEFHKIMNKQINSEKKMICLNDINYQNFIISNNNIYLVDLDEVSENTIENEISQIYLNLMYENHNIKDNLIKLKQTILKFENELKINININQTYKNILNNLELKIKSDKQNKNIQIQRINNLVKLKTNQNQYQKILEN